MHSISRLSFILVACFLIGLVSSENASAQRQNQEPEMTTLVKPTSAEARRAAFAQRQRLFENSLLSAVPVDNIGPTIMSGRVVDIDARPSDPSHFVVAYASGGLWITRNNGQSFDPLFDHEGVMTIGDVAVDWETGTIWVGTGENNSSRSSYSGDGVYKSSDWGKTWNHMGLDGTHRTGRIVLHPANAETVWVASLGALYSANTNRGVYKSTDGGKNWKKTLYVNDRTGAVDLVLDPNNPDVLYAAMWERDRRAWNFVESGPGSGLYKSTDGGSSWTKMNGGNSGFPDGAGVGRIGITVFPGNSNVIYASLDNQDRAEQKEGDEKEEGLTRDALRLMTSQSFLALSKDDVKDYLEREGFPKQYSADVVMDMVKKGTIQPAALVDFVDDANAQLFDTPVIGLEVYRSDDAGVTWTRTHEDNLDGVYSSYGYYFGEIRVSPQDEKQVYAMGVPIIRSDDAGQTWKSIGAGHVHSDHQALWMNPNREGHIINGNDGGLNMSYDAGETWSKLNIPAVGQFYYITTDNAESYRVYGGLQDNGVWAGPHTYQASYDWFDGGDYPYDRLGGGDGMQVQVDTRTNELVYLGSQFGFYSRLDRETGKRASIRPRHELGEKPLRFNWQTPILLSSHNQDIFYYAANRLYRSMNKGDDLIAISPDLTHGGQPGDVPYGTLSAIDESKLKFGLIYAGSDDGMIHVTRDGGVSWKRIDQNLPQNLWVSRVQASSHSETRVYASLNGYRSDHFDSYVYRSDDFGATWTQIGTNLPAEPVNVVLEDPSNPDLIFVGTDHAVYASLDRGKTFMGLAKDMPFVAVHDLKIQARDKHLLIGTHGRSIYLADISVLQQLSSDMLAREINIFDVADVPFSSSWGEKRSSLSSVTEPEVTLTVYAAKAGNASFVVENKENGTLATFERTLSAGLNYVTYDLTLSEAGIGNLEKAPKAAGNGKTYLPAGEYSINASKSGAESAQKLKLVERGGRRFGEPEAAPGVQYEIKK
jgi:photosystem II stability/assembly factor-like uncharacterized protein